MARAALACWLNPAALARSERRSGVVRRAIPLLNILRCEPARAPGQTYLKFHTNGQMVGRNGLSETPKRDRRGACPPKTLRLLAILMRLPWLAHRTPSPTLLNINRN